MALSSLIPRHGYGYQFLGTTDDQLRKARHRTACSRLMHSRRFKSMFAISLAGKLGKDLKQGPYTLLIGRKAHALGLSR